MAPKSATSWVWRQRYSHLLQPVRARMVSHFLSDRNLRERGTFFKEKHTQQAKLCKIMRILVLGVALTFNIPIKNVIEMLLSLCKSKRHFSLGGWKGKGGKKEGWNRLQPQQSMPEKRTGEAAFRKKCLIYKVLHVLKGSALKISSSTPMINSLQLGLSQQPVDAQM